MKRALILLLLLAPVACREQKSASTWQGAPVIIISVDTLRADHLPAYGYRAVETPHLDTLRADSILFTSAYAQAPLTLPSHATLLTGLLPGAHGVRNNIGYRLEKSVPTLAGMLRASGYQTGAAISSFVLRGSTGLRENFDFYDDAIANQTGAATGSLQRRGNVTSRIATEWIAGRAATPFFFLLHLFEPHSPYEPPEPFRSKYASVPYDGEVAASDAIVGEFIASLKASGIYDRAIIILLSDHGEGLSQHGEPEHGIFLYREVVHVPLMIKLPSRHRAGESIAHPVGLVDVLPTIAALTGVAPPAKLDGVSLLAPAQPDRTIYSETFYPRIHLGWSELRSLQGERYHYIQAPRPELYDMTADPAEMRNVLPDQRRVYSSMKSALDKYGSALSAPSRVDPEEARKLAALGYLGATQATPSGPLPDPKDRIGEIAAMGRASALAREGRTAEAITEFRKIVTANPRFSDAWNQLALELERLGRFEEAAEAYRQAIENASELAGEFALSRGGILLRLGKLKEAADHAALGERVNPGGAHLLLARVALARKDHAAAEAEARLAQAEAASHIAASVVLAETLAQRGNPAAALAELDRVEARARDEAAFPVESLDSARGNALARLERYPEAVAAFRRNIAAFPHDQNAYALLAIVHVLTGRIEDAQAVIDELQVRNPYPDARKLAARTRRELGLVAR